MNLIFVLRISKVELMGVDLSFLKILFDPELAGKNPTGLIFLHSFGLFLGFVDSNQMKL